MLFKSNVARINLMQHVAIYSIAKFNRIFASYLKNQWIFALNSRVIISSHNTNLVSRRAPRTQWGSTSSCRNIGRCFSPFDSTGAGPPSKTWASSWRRHWWSGTGRIRPAPPQRSGPPPPYRTPWTQTTSPTGHQNSDSAFSLNIYQQNKHQMNYQTAPILRLLPALPAIPPLKSISGADLWLVVLKALDNMIFLVLAFLIPVCNTKIKKIVFICMHNRKKLSKEW